MTDVTTIALSKLIPSADNVRRVNSEAGISELAASIEANGQLQNLNVRKAKGKFEVVAGARRFAALKLLLKEGRSVQGVAVTKEYPVRVAILTGERDVEISLVENIQRSAMHPADEIEAFRRLNQDEGLPSEEIAARFGISHMTVRRRLKLATLSPRLLEELRKEEVSLEQAEALAISGDHEAQERAWFDVNSFYRQPHYLRSALTKEALSGKSALAQFVTLEAYRAAGGAVEEDLFSTQDSIYLSDRDLVRRLADEKLATLAEPVKAEGWSWVETSQEAVSTYGMRTLYPKQVPLGDEDQQRLEGLQARYEEMEDQSAAFENADDDEADLIAFNAEMDALEEAIEQLRATSQAFTPEQLGVAGAILYVGHGGRVEIRRGIVRKEDEARLVVRDEGQDVAGEGEGAPVVAEPEAMGFNGALTEELTAIRTAALRCQLVETPQVGLVAILHPFAVRTFYADLSYSSMPSSAVEVRGEARRIETSIKEPEACRALVAWNDIMDSWKARLPSDAAELWDWLLDQTPATLGQLLAVVSAANLNAVQMGFEKKRSDRVCNADRIAQAIAFDMRAWWSPEREFLGRVSKATIAGIMKEAGLPDGAAADIERLTKSEAVDRAERDLAGRGWLPEVLKTPEAVQQTEGAEEAEDVEFAEAAE